MKNKWSKWAIISIIWISIWQIIYLSVGEEILIISPLGVVETLIGFISETSFWITIGASLARVMSGFFVAVVFGVLFGAITSFSPFLHDLFFPFFGAVKSTPVASFIILALLWLKTGQVPIFISFLIVLPIVWENVSQGIKNTDPQLLEMAMVYEFSWKKRISLIFIPSVFPYFKAACTTSLGLAWKSGIAAEVISHPAFSIGSALYEGKIYLETSEVFTWTAVVIILSLLIEKLFLIIFGKFKNRIHF